MLFNKTSQYYIYISLIILSYSKLILTRLDTFYLWLYDVGHKINDHSDRKRGNNIVP